MRYSAKDLESMGRTLERAPAGTVFVCGACGKTARKRWGQVERTPGWDESCSMNAVLVNVDDIADPAEWKPWDRVRRVENAPGEDSGGGD